MQAPDSLEAQLPPFLYNGHDSDSSLTDLGSSSDSELSSVGSMSPPPGYLSPISSHGTESRDSSDESQKKKRSRPDGDMDAPARKKRRTPEPKQRSRQMLDLRSSQNVCDQDQQLQTLMKVLRKRRKIVVVAGAGMSVSAGIPDFRSSTGLFKSLKSEHKLKASGKALFDASVYQTEESRSSFHDMVRNLSTMVNTAQPTAFHKMLDRLSAEGRLMRLYTQNVDGIDTQMDNLNTAVPLPTKGPWPRSVQLHGGLEKMVCTKCHQLSDFRPELFDGPSPPPCGTCIEADRVRTDHAGKRSHGIGCLRPRMVLYNEHNPDEEAIGSCVSADLRARPDALIVVGTSMKIPGVKRIVREMCGVVRGRKDGLTVWVNHDDPPTGKEFEDCWDLVVKGPCDEIARQLTCAEEQGSCTMSDVERAKERGEFSVVVPPSPKKVNIGIATPASTPKQEPAKLFANVPKITLKVNPQKAAEEKKAGKLGKPGKKTLAKHNNATKKGKKANIAGKKLPIAVGSQLQNHFTVKKTAKAKMRVQKPVCPEIPMGPVSLADPRVNAPLTFEEASSPSAVQLKMTDEAQTPTTPLRVEIPSCSVTNDWNRRKSLGTISPKSVPNRLDYLFDLERGREEEQRA